MMYSMDFGKHKGKTLEEVAIEDPTYIFWLSEKNVMKIPEDISELASENIMLDNPEVDWEDINHPDWGDRY